MFRSNDYFYEKEEKLTQNPTYLGSLGYIHDYLTSTSTGFWGSTISAAVVGCAIGGLATKFGITGFAALMTLGVGSAALFIAALTFGGAYLAYNHFKEKHAELKMETI